MYLNLIAVSACDLRTGTGYWKWFFYPRSWPMKDLSSLFPRSISHCASNDLPTYTLLRPNAYVRDRDTLTQSPPGNDWYWSSLVQIIAWCLMRHQAIIWTNDDLSPMGPKRTSLIKNKDSLVNKMKIILSADFLCGPGKIGLIVPYTMPQSSGMRVPSKVGTWLK